MINTLAHIILYIAIPGLVILLLVWSGVFRSGFKNSNKRYQVRFKLNSGRFKIDNIKRGVSLIGSAGSGKTESVVYNLMQHFSEQQFCGIIHDYKHFELTEIAYPLFKTQHGLSFYTVSFDCINSKVNPIAPRYLPNEESVNELSRVLIENLLEVHGETNATSRFFSDAVEGLLAGMIWKMKTDYPKRCTLPHIIALFQSLPTKRLIAFLSSNLTAKSMASAFINGIESEKQTAGVKSTLSNAFKKISSQNIFMVLSEDQVPLDLNHPDYPSVISVVNNPKYESAYAPIIATIMHTAVKQMSVRNRKPSFVLMEEAPTIKLLNMPRIPATLRSFDVATIYVMQDKIQNDILYGDKASKAILSNLSYQFFGKANDPDTARYYERFFEMIKVPTRSISKNSGLSMESRVTKGEREVSKRRASTFFRLKQGEFVAFADGKDRKVRFKLQNIEKALPMGREHVTVEELKFNYEKIYREIAMIIKTT
ncbi:type IV secretion system DNA-binding domain-containing protein [Tamlana sp. 2_MG-2023]|uniref:type IV secretory system conjugative DNA transfer family protein n=1 Tax=unclassified Tamlana TaxID=2614803 RepID=UPI0026E3CE26|nr:MULTISPECIES: type IV secretion system DNA-binding domain-containing protein [unclassified Tamlana]MDO6761899.1 type IV secretion system DNA-binding domain-containing protein [Tamlana sp. 2_MG-2023]MDO6792656.1 type IV secretion system DNA-binding domain-containing protein [Tamlana sp. 1_MG-2023]